MKYTSAVAAAALLGSANAGVHKMKLKKIPLSEQLVCDHLSKYLLSNHQY
jgi:saccharopepsin